LILIVVAIVILILLVLVAFFAWKKLQNRKKGFTAAKAFSKKGSTPATDVPGYEKQQDLYDPWDVPHGSVDGPAATYKFEKTIESTLLLE
jgi:FtsZ-interacting cell division protein ZipA